MSRANRAESGDNQPDSGTSPSPPVQGRKNSREREIKKTPPRAVARDGADSEYLRTTSSLSGQSSVIEFDRPLAFCQGSLFLNQLLPVWMTLVG